MSSPYIAQLVGEPGGKLRGKQAVGEYWRIALQRNPTLHFELLSTLVGVDSIVLYYEGARGMAAEAFFFDASGSVVRASAHYA
jgi:hypothetical protein